MARKKRPPIPPIAPEPGWTDYRSGARPEIFANEFVEALVRKFKIERTRIPELKKFLEDWADVFRVHKWGADDRPRANAIKTELELVRTRIDDLRATLERLHPDTERRFWRLKRLSNFRRFRTRSLQRANTGMECSKSKR